MKTSTTHTKKSCIFYAIFLASLWTLSLICGGLLAANDPSVVVLMRLAPYNQVSIVGLIYVIFLPFAISFVFHRQPRWLWIYAISALKAFLTGYILFGISCAYGACGWLIYSLLLFTCTAVNVLLVHIWSDGLLTSHSQSGAKLIVSMILGLVFGVLDYVIISPFLISLLRNI